MSEQHKLWTQTGKLQTRTETKKEMFEESGSRIKIDVLRKLKWFCDSSKECSCPQEVYLQSKDRLESA